MINQKRLTDRQFKRYCTLVYNETGIYLTEDKRELLNARLAKRLRKLEIHADEYLKVILNDSREMVKFVDAISTNHTFFFRESRSFNFLGHDCSRIWCAASSSGEEPYSLAAYCYHLGIKSSILATDISDECLEKGRRGIYPIQGIANIPIDILKKGFQKGRNQWAGYARIKPEIKKMVQFERFNLLKDRVPEMMFDVIFCRNVMIYFDNPTKEKVVGNLCRVLRPKGYFIIGGAESLNGLNHDLKYIEPSVYLKL